MNFHDINPLLYSRSTKRLKIEFHDDNNFTKRDSTHEKTVTLYESPKETSFFRIQTSNTGRSKKNVHNINIQIQSSSNLLSILGENITSDVEVENTVTGYRHHNFLTREKELLPHHQKYAMIL